MVANCYVRVTCDVGVVIITSGVAIVIVAVLLVLVSSLSSLRLMLLWCS